MDHLAYGPGGRRAIGRNTADPARWKRYRGGRVGQLWMEDGSGGRFSQLKLQGNLSTPMWLGERLYFLSDAEGIANLYSCAPDGSALRRHTHHADYYARHAATDGQRIVPDDLSRVGRLAARTGWSVDLGVNRLFGLQSALTRSAS